MNKKKIEEILREELKLLGYELVEFKFSLFSNEYKLSLFIDILGSNTPKCTLTIGECSKISKSIAAFIDKRAMFGVKAYYLEVSTPGLERKLNTLADFRRFTGQNCKVKYKELGKAKNILAQIESVVDDFVIFKLPDKKILKLIYNDIESTRLRY